MGYGGLIFTVSALMIFCRLGLASRPRKGADLFGDGCDRARDRGGYRVRIFPDIYHVDVCVQDRGRRGFACPIFFRDLSSQSSGRLTVLIGLGLAVLLLTLPAGRLCRDHHYRMGLCFALVIGRQSFVLIRSSGPCLWYRSLPRRLLLGSRLFCCLGLVAPVSTTWSSG